jgi:putative sterol carrier protein
MQSWLHSQSISRENEVCYEAVWVAISTGKLAGQQAFMEQKYKASGDFSLLMSLNRLFSTS